MQICVSIYVNLTAFYATFAFLLNPVLKNPGYLTSLLKTFKYVWFL